VCLQRGPRSLLLPALLRARSSATAVGGACRSSRSRGTFHLVGRTQAGNPTGFQPDGDSIQFKPTNPQLLNQLDQPGRPYRLTSIGSTQLRLEAIDALELHFDRTDQPVSAGWRGASRAGMDACRAVN
jgi:hypothetical protein